MLLAVNVGNTQTKIGLFDRRELVQHWAITTQTNSTADELALTFHGLLTQAGLAFSRNVTGVVVSSVVPRTTQALHEMVGRYFHFDPVIVGPGVRTGMPIVIDNPREVGADRIVNAIAAHARYGGPCIVMDTGTATTFDAVSAKGEYLGGSIAPGMEISLSALVQRTAQLHSVSLVEPRSVIGKSTTEAMQSGMLYGFAGLVEGIVARMRDELGPDTPTIATGGLAPVLMPLTKSLDYHEPWLTLEGLLIIYDRNTSGD